MLVTTIKDLQILLQKVRSENKTIGFVPTMGALHSGHLSLVAAANSQTNQVVVSIFVNPTQFNNAEDLKKYPKNLTNDVQFIREDYPNTIIFAPEVAEMYARGEIRERFDFEGIEKVMEGAFRQGHFDGVGTVVKQLFSIVQPDKAFFGEKDYQQLAIIKKLVTITKQPVQIIACPTEREPNGLAKSSRNQRLNEQQKQQAGIIFEGLSEMKASFSFNTQASSLKQLFKERIQAVEGFDLEYIEISNQDTLQPVECFTENTKYRAFAAVYVGEVRLIDNIALN